MASVSPLDNVRIVLCATSHPGNIGASARALKTMGLASLYLVNPKILPDADAHAMAAHAADVLDAATVCASLDEALHGTVFAAACTARSRHLSHPVLSARETGVRLVQEAARGPVALVFGPEKHGLTAQEVTRCSVIATIPTGAQYTSLNLAAAVQILAYEVQQASRSPGLVPERYPPAAYEEIVLLFQHLEQTLYDIEFLDPKRPKRLMQRLRRLFQRTRLEQEEVNVLRGILAAAQKKAQAKD